MKILIISDVHNTKKTTRKKHDKTLSGVENLIKNTPCDLIVFLGDTVHGPDFENDCSDYEKYLREVLDLTDNKPFAFVFGNHDDECEMTKEAILEIVNSYPNSVTKGLNFTFEADGETLLFIDSGSYYEGDESCYAVVDKETVKWAENEISGKKAILFQHIIIYDIMSVIEKGKNGRYCFKEGVEYSGKLGERPCPPDFDGGEFSALAPHLKGALFGHDHKNDFEVELSGVKIIQCAGAGYNAYENDGLCRHNPSAKLLDTKTMKTELILF